MADVRFIRSLQSLKQPPESCSRSCCISLQVCALIGSARRDSSTQCSWQGKLADSKFGVGIRSHWVKLLEKHQAGMYSARSGFTLESGASLRTHDVTAQSLRVKAK